MSLSIGIVGLPNVGKSTLFKTLTKKQVLIANYPFATIDPNIGVVLVPDERVDKLAELSHSAKKIYATVDFVDIAGLVKGASTGEGLGNKFLANIREVDAVLYVLRAFKNADIINTQTEINPLKEKEILDVELILKDLETVNKRIDAIQGDVRQNKKESIKENTALQKAKEYLSQEKVLCDMPFSEEEKEILNSFQLLTFKPRLYLLNGVPEEIIDVGRLQNSLVLDIAQEYESAEFTAEERAGLGLPAESGLDILIKKAYELLGLITFLTTGEDETRAWTIKKGDTAPIAGAVIHTDFLNKFVKAEVVFWKDLLEAGSYAKAREQGKLRTEGKEYVVQDGDVIEFKHG
ncbi:MAG: redox-regulated ATPase YchF [Candidatus Staskawiczbacteria bacterium RIFOXYD2_FULL_37_9]|uniref:Redox-regulated ATPase YchF n=1 Tax=Candidatus Staskawiczbacteria bacterium RIFOXYB1_FULL_37_44 TaxID=1802223 RepID=A0A1G2IXI1_9BACT|nr:MAG: redox-regulated ATPase YchF [Candidatus Staskawiczbacteria bacterium RIFOXYB1_FULL_37_44]OGZ83681.1 MAG: redox-regulated ATPase YchF [Candidatus Staskawiczbacteria bacterium RIFOXYC1_FULL_37_52]OGZ90205.1 MAG: redox-regulated ATPase YchF [Candidatus Staskawiczbacteria bacterium RIFOXYD1_FULL_37_110]OGZ94850.1 MAG: redox-regulated ATPase YchF [Candidatus Staskawiczbacteria bacterium RIFOXYD2_FULL_37_9]